MFGANEYPDDFLRIDEIAHPEPPAKKARQAKESTKISSKDLDGYEIEQLLHLVARQHQDFQGEAFVRASPYP